MSRAAAFLAGILLVAAALPGSVAAPPPGKAAMVKWAGSIGSKPAGGGADSDLALESLSSVQHLYAVGTLAGQRGEITVIDGRPSIARIAGGGVGTETSLKGKAALLVYGEVPEWRESRLDDGVAYAADLEDRVRDAAKSSGLDVAAPFPFLVKGTAERVTLSVLDLKDGAAKVFFQLQNQPVRIVGFYSDRHQGVFTPADSKVHMHVLVGSGSVSGHLEGLKLAPGATLSLPPAGR